MKKKSGFTVIEVSLVLVIAGLIFLMAFIALPSLWASQRDSDRKARVMELTSDIKTYQTNNSRGALPVISAHDGVGPEIFTWSEARGDTAAASNTWKALIRDYVNVDFSEPSGNEYSFYVIKCYDKDGRDTLSIGQDCARDLPVRQGADYFTTINSADTVNFGGKLDDTLYIVIGSTCDGDHAVKTNSSRSVSVLQVLERTTRYCYNT